MKIHLAGHCVDGNARLDSDGVPYFFWGGEWSPICGHYFWDNQEGAKAFCQELGFQGGKFNRANSAYSQDAIEIGKCAAGQTIDSCTSGSNQYKLTGWCKAGHTVKITIACEGNKEGSAVSSCKGKKP